MISDWHSIIAVTADYKLQVRRILEYECVYSSRMGKFNETIYYIKLNL